MKFSAETALLAGEIESRCKQLPHVNAPNLRLVRREISKQLKESTPKRVLQLALCLIEQRPWVHRFFAYEIVCKHRATMDALTLDDLLKLGKGIHSWDTVDCFACYLAGPLWAAGRIADETIAEWAESEDLWWRRTALVSTVALSRRGQPVDMKKAKKVCAMLVADREDMIVKAMSWALRELAKKNPEVAGEFVERHRERLAARVLREVNNKLTTGLKTPRKA